MKIDITPHCVCANYDDMHSIVFALNERYIYIQKEESGEDYRKKIEEYNKVILDRIQTAYYNLPFDFILDALTHLGWDVNLLFDDNGHWAIACPLYSTVSLEETADYSTSFRIEKKAWFNTPSAALLDYLQETTNEENDEARID